MKFTNSTLVCLVISLCIALTSAQFFGGFGRSPNSLTQLTGDFGGPTAFSGFPTAAGGRDPRQNRGPVVFPPSPQDATDESSGVIVGASGFGFVPPQSQIYHFYLKQKYKAYTAALLAAEKKKIPKKYVLVKGVPPTPRPGYKFVAIYPNKVNPYL